jgi:hypothetical protein
MKSANEIKRLVRKVRFRPNAAADERILTYAEAALEKSVKTKSALAEPTIWRIIMKSRIIKLTAAAAVIIIATVLSIIVLDKSVTPAYSMEIVAEQFQKADTIHILHWFSFEKSPTIEEQTEYHLEDWIDIKSGCVRTNGVARVPAGFKFTRVEQVFDGKYLMDIDHGLKSVKFYKKTEFQKRLYTRQSLETFIQRISMTSNKRSGYIKVGQERVDDTLFDIWQRETSYRGGRLLYKVICWVHPGSRELKRVEHWEKDKESEAQWVLTSEMDVEFNTVPPSDTFNTTPPAGYKQVNTKETTFARRLFNRSLPLETIQGEVAAVFTLDNGCIIMGYFNKDIDGDGPTDEVFEELQLGDDLPKLPVEIYGLQLREDGITFADDNYVGRHLAYTKKGEKIYEWGIYVPEKEIIPGDGWRSYKMLARLHPAGRQDSQVKWFDQSSLRSFAIRANEFDTFVRGAMAECSDEAVAPGHVTYDNVSILIKEIKASMEQ